MPSHYGSAYGKKGMKGNAPMKRKDKKPVKSKPDFLDFDKDGNRKESMKKALSDAKGKKMPATKAAGKKKLTARQEAALEKHSEHHTAKHMAMMRKLMREGKTFTDAHRLTQKAIGR